MANGWGNNGNSDILLVSKITMDGDCSHEIKRWLLLVRKGMRNLDIILKSRDITWLTKICIIKAMVFPVVMYGCERWTIKKNWCIQTVVLEATLQSLFDYKDIKTINPKGNQSWILIVRTDAEAEASILWLCDAKNLLFGKDPDPGKG